MDLEIIDPIEYPGWDDLLLPIPEATIFHTSSWARVLSQSYRYHPFYFTVIERDRFRVLLPVMEVNSLLTGKRGVSIPFTDSCEPILTDGILFQDLFDFIIQWGRKRGWKSFELRGGKSYLPGTPPSSVYLQHTLDLSENKEKVFAGFRESTKRNIRKAIRERVEIEISQSLQSIPIFYKLNAMTRKEHGLPPQPYRFFKKVYEHILTGNRGFIVNAFFAKRPIASSVYFPFGETVIYKYGASDKRYQHFRANNLVMWEAIKWSCEKGYRSFCFGRTEPEHRGLGQFKKGWNAKENEIRYYKFDIRKNSFLSDHKKIDGVYQSVLRKLPVSILKIMGSVLYRHLG